MSEKWDVVVSEGHSPAIRFLIAKYGFKPTPFDWSLRNKFLLHLKLKADHEGTPFDKVEALDLANQKMIEVHMRDDA